METDRPIRSYVLRQARMSRLQQEAFDTLYDRYSIPLAESEVDLPEVFRAHRSKLMAGKAIAAGGSSSRRDIILEIGFGMGKATVEIARHNPDRDYLGIEVHAPGVGKLLSEVALNHLSNVLIVRADAVDVLSRMIAPETLAGVHIFFPDPWPKKRHHKRRLIQRDFVRLLVSRIRDGGYLYLATDWADYAEWILEVLNGTPEIENTAIDFVERQQWRPQTRFEEKALIENRKIYDLIYRVRR
jgi:tRNA (guanine-N7-)-methyltransferase